MSRAGSGVAVAVASGGEESGPGSSRLLHPPGPIEIKSRRGPKRVVMACLECRVMEPGRGEWYVRFGACVA